MAIVFIGQLLSSFLVSSLLFYQKERGYFYEIARSAKGALAYVADSRGKIHIPPEKW